MTTPYGPNAFMDDAVLTAATIAKAHLAPPSPDSVTEAKAVLEQYVERFGLHGCPALVAALAELMAGQAEDREKMLASIEAQELTVLTRAQQRDE